MSLRSAKMIRSDYTKSASTKLTSIVTENIIVQSPDNHYNLTKYNWSCLIKQPAACLYAESLKKSYGIGETGICKHEYPSYHALNSGQLTVSPSNLIFCKKCPTLADFVKNVVHFLLIRCSWKMMIRKVDPFSFQAEENAQDDVHTGKNEAGDT